MVLLSSLGRDDPPEYRRSFLVPLLEVPTFIVLLNLFDRYILDKNYAHTHGLNTFWNHLAHGPWKYDRDIFFTNFVGHPYSGAVYFNFARSSGLPFWWSFGYSVLGSTLYELGGETGAVSINDQVTTPVAGAFLGEALYRIYAMVLQSGDESPGFWRELSAFLIDPAGGFNRLLFKDRFRTAEFDEQPGIFLMASAGAGYVWETTRARREGNSSDAIANATLDLSYGLLADPTLRLRRPFDLFRMHLGLRGENHGLQELIAVNGILIGENTHRGAFHGAWGLVGSYDDVNVELFRLASVGVGVGGLGQLNLSPAVALGADLILSGILMGAGTSRVPFEDSRDYHLGPGYGQAALGLRLYLGERSMIDLHGQQFFLNGVSRFPGSENQTHLQLLIHLRIVGPHAIRFAGASAFRSSRNPGEPELHQRVWTLLVGYSWISDERFGAAPRRAFAGLGK